ncbi:MAG: type II toxin-antitoxin system Phd/YefM family antitoxin [Methylococcaceae bacterium]
MNTVWTHEEAKNSFDSLMEEALAHHVQIIELKNQQKIIVISLEDYKKNLKPKDTLVDFFKKSPLYDLPLDLDLERDKDTGRTIEL